MNDPVVTEVVLPGLVEWNPRTCVLERDGYDAAVLLKPNEGRLFTVFAKRPGVWMRTIDIADALWPGMTSLSWLTTLSNLKSNLGDKIAVLGLVVEAHQGHGYRLMCRAAVPTVLIDDEKGALLSPAGGGKVEP